MPFYSFQLGLSWIASLPNSMILRIFGHYSAKKNNIERLFWELMRFWCSTHLHIDNMIHIILHAILLLRCLPFTRRYKHWNRIIHILFNVYHVDFFGFNTRKLDIFNDFLLNYAKHFRTSSIIANQTTKIRIKKNLNATQIKTPFYDVVVVSLIQTKTKLVCTYLKCSHHPKSNALLQYFI